MDANKIQCFPNPAQTLINFKIKEGEYSGDLSINNASGQLVLHQNLHIASGLSVINIQTLAPGCYTYIFRTGKDVYSGRFVKAGS